MKTNLYRWPAQNKISFQKKVLKYILMLTVEEMVVLKLYKDDCVSYLYYRNLECDWWNRNLKAEECTTKHGVNKWPEPLSQILQHQFS